MKYQLMATAAAVMLALPANARDIEMQSIYPGTLPLLGSSGAELGDRVSMLTGGELNFVFRNPGEIVAGDDLGLPDDFQPVPPERWLRQPARRTNGPAGEAAAR